MIVIDDASIDGTLEVLAAHRAQLAVLVSESDRGIYDALNKGIARASGDVVGFLHADDLYADAHVLARIAAAFADPAVDAVYGDLVYVSQADTGWVIRHWRAGGYRPARLRWGWMPPHPTLYLRRALYERHGGFDLHYRIAADYDLMLRVLSRLTGRVVYLPKVVGAHAVGRDQQPFVAPYPVKILGGLPCAAGESNGGDRCLGLEESVQGAAVFLQGEG